KARVQDVSQGVAEEIEAEYGQAEGGAGSKQKPGSVEEVLAVPVRQVHSPRRRSDGDAVTEEGEAGLDEDDATDDRGVRDNYNRKAVLHDMAKHHPKMGRAQRCRCFYVSQRAFSQH